MGIWVWPLNGDFQTGVFELFDSPTVYFAQTCLEHARKGQIDNMTVDGDIVKIKANKSVGSKHQSGERIWRLTGKLDPKNGFEATWPD
jgi:hypothetical protein